MTMPWHRELGEDLCAYDAGRHSRPPAIATISSTMPSASWAPSCWTAIGCALGERTSRRRRCPIGIDVKEVERLTASAEAQRPVRRRCTARLGERALIIGVDRLDYSKGIAERLRGYQTLLSDYPQHRRKVVFMQISAPSREDLPEYRDMRRAIERLAGHVDRPLRRGRLDAAALPEPHAFAAHARRLLSRCRGSAWSRRCATG